MSRELLPVCPQCAAGDHAQHDEYATRTPDRWVVCCCRECEVPAPPLLIDPRLTTNYPECEVTPPGCCLFAIVATLLICLLIAAFSRLA